MPGDFPDYQLGTIVEQPVPTVPLLNTFCEVFSLIEFAGSNELPGVRESSHRMSITQRSRRFEYREILVHWPVRSDHVGDRQHGRINRFDRFPHIARCSKHVREVDDRTTRQRVCDCTDEEHNR